MANSRLKVGSAAAGGAGAAAALIMAIQLVGGHEGVRTKVYKDIVGVTTSCYGHTGPDIHMGMRFTMAQCKKQFGDDLLKYEAQMRSCMTKPDAVPIHVYIAMLDTEYNIGRGAFCKSSMATAINAGDYVRACDKLLSYTYAGGHRVEALLRRREETREFCLKDAA